VETDEQKIKAITVWASNHSKVDRPLPKIGMKYLNDLLEYIEDMKLLSEQSDMQVLSDRLTKKITKQLESELFMIKSRTEAGRVEEEIEQKSHSLYLEHKMEFQHNLYKEDNAILYLKVIPVKFILKSLFKRLFTREEE